MFYILLFCLENVIVIMSVAGSESTVIVTKEMEEVNFRFEMVNGLSNPGIAWEQLKRELISKYACEMTAIEAVQELFRNPTGREGNLCSVWGGNGRTSELDLRENGRTSGLGQTP